MKSWPRPSRKFAGELGQLDILVCGAAGNFPAAAAKMSASGFKAVVDIDLLGTFNSARAAFEYLRKPGAAVINISAPQASMPMAYQSHVCAGKAGVDMITRTLAIEWGPLGVRVNSVVPGPIARHRRNESADPDRGNGGRAGQSAALQRYGEKEEIAELVLFLASDAAKYITGAVVPAMAAVVWWAREPGCRRWRARCGRNKFSFSFEVWFRGFGRCW